MKKEESKKVSVNVNVESKSWWTSKTFVLGCLSVIGGVLTWINGQIDAGVSITVMGSIMTVLRVISEKKIKFFND